jgi:excinuclease ABC subunit C
MRLDLELENVKFTIPKKGEKFEILALSTKNAKQYRFETEKLRSLVDPERHSKRILAELQKDMHLPEPPVVIECFDNSNFQGDYAVAGMVQFVNGKPNKSGYRHFNIKTVEGPDDYASMKEVVRRRYSRLKEEGKDLPNLIITDGGKGQMEVVRQVIEDELHLEIPIAGLAKDDRHRTNELLYGFPPKTVQIKPNSEVFKLLTHIQDEVHRFAITFHRKQFQKGFVHSELNDIKGIGKTTAEKLLLELKSVKNIKEADLQKLSEIIGPAKATIVYNHFH